jgi:hypothetical protein
VKSSIQYCWLAALTDPLNQYNRLEALVRAAVMTLNPCVRFALRKPGNSLAKFETLPNGLAVVVALRLLPSVIVGYGLMPPLPLDRGSRSSPPNLNACFPRLQLSVSA